MRWIKVRFENPKTDEKSKPMMVSEKNPYFDWYKKNWKVLKRMEM